jgi:glucose-1-phosphate adenylyltransferase
VVLDSLPDRAVLPNIRRAIIDKNVDDPRGGRRSATTTTTTARGFAVTEAGITVVGKGQVVTP